MRVVWRILHRYWRLRAVRARAAGQPELAARCALLSEKFCARVKGRVA